HPHQQSQTGLAAVVYGRGVGVAPCLGVAARRSHGAAPTWGSTTAAAITAFCSLAAVADHGGCQTLSALTEHPCVLRLIREGSCVRYRFQLLSMDAPQAWLCVPGHGHSAGGYSVASGTRGSHDTTGGRCHRRPDVSIVLTEPYAKTREQNQSWPL